MQNTSEFANAAASRPPSTLDSLANRIMNAARLASEIGNKLNDHADAIFGPMPQPSLAGLTKGSADQPVAALGSHLHGARRA